MSKPKKFCAFCKNYFPPMYDVCPNCRRDGCAVLLITSYGDEDKIDFKNGSKLKLNGRKRDNVIPQGIDAGKTVVEMSAAEIKERAPHYEAGQKITLPLTDPVFGGAFKDEKFK